MNDACTAYGHLYKRNLIANPKKGFYYIQVPEKLFTEFFGPYLAACKRERRILNVATWGPHNHLVRIEHACISGTPEETPLYMYTGGIGLAYVSDRFDPIPPSNIKAPFSTKPTLPQEEEPTMSTKFFEKTVTYTLLGMNLNDCDNSKISSAIAGHEIKIEKLQGLKQKPRRIQLQITAMQKELEDLCTYLDEQDRGDQVTSD